MSQKLNVDHIVKGMILEIGEGVPGAMIAIMVMKNTVSTEKLVDNLLAMEDMNIRGSQIWAAFKYYAKEDPKVFCDAISERNLDMIECVNRDCPERVAVQYGGSKENG